MKTINTKKRLKIKELALNIGVDPSHVSRILGGKVTPSPRVAELLEKATGTPKAAWIWPTTKNNPFIRRPS